VDELLVFPVPGSGTDGFAVGDGFSVGTEGLPTILIWIVVEGVAFAAVEDVVLATGVCFTLA
jgi:hypothetical protein